MVSLTNRRDRRAASRLWTLCVVALGALIAGCGGQQDYGDFQRSLGGDIGTGYNTSLGARYGSQTDRHVGVLSGTYPMIETSFQLASVPGDPFDYEQVNVQVSLRKPDGGVVDVPAFFDGGTTWRMRYTPSAPGTYAVVSVKLNRETAHEEKLEKKEWTVKGDPQPGFVRIDRGDHSRFVLDNGGRYFPLGQNQAWHSDKLPDIPDLFAKMHAAGENWARVWMTSWDGKNLDWPADGKPKKLGDIDLEAAKKWDGIIDAADKDDIYVQLCIQHHGQVSSEVDPNWKDNPYNASNGGFLHSPKDFFTDPQARALTRRKLYYILSRWGYSPHIMAWELFNEVENTDAARSGQWDNIAMWHREMAIFLRRFDGYRHLITTSANPGVALNSPIWDTVDYIQVHRYAQDIISAVGTPLAVPGKKLDKPIFVGEFGSAGLHDPDGIYLHAGLWASLMSGMSGAAQYWSWDNVDEHNLYGEFQAAQAFVTASGLPGHGGLVPTTLAVETSRRAALRFGPGGGFDKAAQSEFVVGSEGVPSGIEKFPAYLQGKNHHDMTPQGLTFQVNYPQPGAFLLTVGKVAKAGAHVTVSVDGKAVERDYPSADADYAPKEDTAVLKADVPAGAHTIKIDNTGQDWVLVGMFGFTNYVPALAANARVGSDYLAAWVYDRDTVYAPAGSAKEPTSGRLTLPALKPGRYRVMWWDTHAGKSLDSSELVVGKEKTPVSLATPPITGDAALVIAKAGLPEAGSARGKPPRKGKSGNASARLPETSTTSLGTGTTSLPAK